MGRRGQGQDDRPARRDRSAIVVRYQGGDNAGHTVVIGDEVFKLHLVPSGVLYPHITPVIGNGVVVNPQTLLDEMAMLAARGVGHRALRVSAAAHVIMPYHVALDGAAGGRAWPGGGIGTTHRGIGPAYADRAARPASAWATCSSPPSCGRPSSGPWPEKNALARPALPGLEPFELEPLVRARPSAGASSCATGSSTPRSLVQAALAAGEHVLLEGAQGALLDLDHGTYPFVTSSNPVAGGACTGGGVGPLQVDEVIGVMKAYSTRVGVGPVPDRAGRRRSASTCSRRAASSARRPAGGGAAAGSTSVPLRYGRRRSTA